MGAEMMTESCKICCHETRNAIAAVVYYTKQVQKTRPTMESHLLEEAIRRLDAAQKGCAK